jgi:hypothetical protein
VTFTEPPFVWQRQAVVAMQQQHQQQPVHDVDGLRMTSPGLPGLTEAGTPAASTPAADERAAATAAAAAAVAVPRSVGLVTALPPALQTAAEVVACVQACHGGCWPGGRPHVQVVYTSCAQQAAPPVLKNPSHVADAAAAAVGDTTAGYDDGSDGEDDHGCVEGGQGSAQQLPVIAPHFPDLVPGACVWGAAWISRRSAVIILGRVLFARQGRLQLSIAETQCVL